MTTHEVTLDLDKTLQLPPPTITARQGDTQCGITAMVTDHGEPATLTGYTAKFQAAKPDGTYAEQAAQISGSTVTVELDPQFLAAAGLIRTAYFRFFEGTAEKESTQNMCIRVIHDAEGEAPDLSTSYIPTVDQLVEDATEALNSANTALGNAEEALEDAEAATDSATDAAASANAAANAAQSAIDAMTGNVLRGTVGPSEVVSVDDAYPQVPLGVKVKGVTRQNLWSNPSGTNNGVTVTSNGDGSMTLSGTATSAASVSSADSYIIKPSTAYTLSMNAALTGASFVVTEYDAAGSQLAQHNVSSTSAASFTSSASVARCVMSLSVQSGQTVSGTYRVMLNEGSEAQPWCPPGLNSVNSVEVVQAGKNFIPFRNVSTTHNGVSIDVKSDGSIDFSGTATARAQLKFPSTFVLPAGTYTLSGARDGIANMFIGYSENGVAKYVEPYYSNGVVSFSLKNAVVARFVADVRIAGAVNCTLRPQLELGSVATDYEPPSVSSTAIPLLGNELRSLPDGTRDELHIDADGEVTLTKRMGHVELDGSQSFSWQSDASSSYWESDDIARMNDYSQSMLCDRLPVKAHGYSEKDLPQSITGYRAPITTYPGQNWVYVRTPNATDATQVKTWLTSNPTLLLYQLAKPQTISLGKVDLPALPGPTANVWAVATDGHGNTFTLQPEIELEYARDVTLVIGSLEAKVAALELLHETE